MIENPEEIELRSEEVQEILGTPPSWLIRWGTLVAFLCVMGLIAVSWYVKYPDIVVGKITIATPNLPAKVVPLRSGILDKLLVAEGDTIQKGTLLALMESTANIEDILLLEKRLKKIQNAKSSSILRFRDEGGLQLGELQTNYSSFIQNFKDYKRSLGNNLYLQQIAQLEEKIEQTIELKKNNIRKELAFRKELERGQVQFKRQKKLYETNVISLQAFEKEQDKYEKLLQRKNDFHEREINLDMTIADYEGRITDIRKNTSETNNSKYVTVSGGINDLLSAIESWKKQFILVAPIGGVVSMTNTTEEQQFVEGGKELMTIVPKEKNMVGVLQLPILGSGKVEIGQDVNIKLESFPFQEYGIVRGKIKHKDLVPRNDGYEMEVDLPSGLETSYGKTLNFQQQMLGRAEVITKDRRILERIFDKVLSAFYNT